MPEISRQKTAVPKISRADFFIGLDDNGETFAGKLFQNGSPMLDEAVSPSFEDFCAFRQRRCISQGQFRSLRISRALLQHGKSSRPAYEVAPLRDTNSKAEDWDKLLTKLSSHHGVFR